MFQIYILTKININWLEADSMYVLLLFINL
jgi:hypothetical protein